jgi:hypothetical protein
VHPSQPILPQLLNVLTQGLQHAEVLPSHSLSLGRQGNRAITGKCWERGGGAVLQVKPFLPPRLHRSGHGDFKVGIYSMPHLNMDNRTHGDRQLNFGILRAPNGKEAHPHIKLRVDPQVSLTQSHEGHNMQDPRGSKGTGAVACQIPAHRMLQRIPRIPP